jgi:hypothetical protein
MKKNLSSIFTLTAAVLAILTMLTGCAIPSLTATSTSTSAAAITSAELPANYTNAVTADLQLALGIMKLEGTANQVDSTTAASILPLWKAMQSLSTADTTAPAELNAIVKQLVAGMSAAQLKAIAAMQLTSADLAQVSSPANNANASAAQSSAAANAAMPADLGANGGAGGPPSGDMPSSGAPSGGSSTTVKSTSSSSAATSSNQSGAHLSTESQVYAMVIQLLTKRAQASA